jgi:hypothetical protein
MRRRSNCGGGGFEKPFTAADLLMYIPSLLGEAVHGDPSRRATACFFGRLRDLRSLKMDEAPIA